MHHSPLRCHLLDDYVGDFRTCLVNIEEAKLFEIGLEYCGVIGYRDESYCNPCRFLFVEIPFNICPNANGALLVTLPAIRGFWGSHDIRGDYLYC
jgi:hypothetical protein